MNRGSGSGRSATVALLALLVAGCAEGYPTAPGSGDGEPVAAPAGAAAGARPPGGSGELHALAREVRALAARQGIRPMPGRRHVRPALAELGRMLAFDPILSGNRNISCMTCHVPRHALGDTRSLAIGEGATGLGPDRVHPDGTFIPRNAPPLFDLSFLDHLFFDGRVEELGGNRFRTPAGGQLTRDMTGVFRFGAVSALPLFPVADRAEMRGQPGENELADVPDDDFQAIWAGLMRRLGGVPEYRRLFEAAYPGTGFEQMSFAHAANAIGGFFVDAFSFDDAPWDRFLRGDRGALTEEQLLGARNFLTAPCVTCHHGPTFSDDEFHNVALAQFGPGEGNGPSGRDDFGRLNVTGDPGDLYRFRTPPLRNVELTGPYGHAGQFAELDAFIDHYSRNDEKLLAYTDADIPEPLLRATLVDNKAAVIDTRSPFIRPAAFDAVFVRRVTAFMGALTDDRARDLLHVVPGRVPSGLPVER